MPTYLFQVSHGKFSNAGIANVFEDAEAACNGALATCADLGRDILCELTVDPEWQLNVIDGAGNPVFRISIVAKKTAMLNPEEEPPTLWRPAA
jgi:uncharacterized protein DUF6894